MADEVCSVCSKEGAKKCSKCKMQFYCSVECQRKDWKSHRRICREIADTRHNKELTGPKTGIDDIPGGLKDFVFQALSGASAMGMTTLVPEYHKEYKKLYPREQTNYEKLRDTWLMAKAMDETLFGAHMVEFSREYDVRDLLKRWQYFEPELPEFLATNPKPGDIFTTRVVNPYGTITTTSGKEGSTVYQTMRNTPVQPMKFQLGKTYICIGFVDIFNLLMGSFVEDDRGECGPPMTFIGYDKSEVLIARALVIFDMILNRAGAASILQVWFSTGWNEEAQKEFKEACGRLVAQDDPKKAERIEKLLNFWNITEVPVKSVLPLWRQLVGEYQLEPLNNLQYEKDRTDYARYMLTGQIFGKDDKDYTFGNVTMFCLPKEFDNYQRQDQNFYAALSMTSFQYKTSLLESVTGRVTAGLRNLAAHIRRRRIVCKFLLKDLKITDAATLKEIKEMDATLIDWSNIPDYLPIADFFAVAEACSGAETVHSLHSMNWQFHVFGASLIDYDNKSSIYKNLKKEMAEQYKRVKKNRPFLRQDQYLLYFMNAADYMLCAKYRQTFMDYFFKGQNVVVNKPTSEEFNPFERSNTCFFLSFRFQK